MNNFDIDIGDIVQHRGSKRVGIVLSKRVDVVCFVFDQSEAHHTLVLNGKFPEKATWWPSDIDCLMKASQNEQS